MSSPASIPAANDFGTGTPEEIKLKLAMWRAVVDAMRSGMETEHIFEVACLEIHRLTDDDN